jgi:hypothetical protein
MFTLTIYFIVLNVYVEFVLIYRPHPVGGQVGGKDDGGVEGARSLLASVEPTCTYQ